MTAFKFSASRAAVLGALALASCATFAAAPMVKTQAPGYYRMMLGDFEVTVLSDGTTDLPVHQLLKDTPGKTEKTLAKSFLRSPLETSFNSFLINTGGKLVLVDTGAGSLFGPNLGKMLENLKASGYKPEQVDEIYITHLHGDHVGGVMSADQMAFPNAVVRMDKRDADFWLSKVQMEKAPADMKGFFAGAMKVLSPYANAGKLQPFDGNTDLAPGVKATSSFGHTPGHTTYVVESKGEKLVLIGDLMHVQAVQFAEPDVVIAFDIDNKAARAERKAAFAAAAKQGYLIGAAHLPFPGVGHLRGNGKGYQFIPVNYTIPR
ncbi:MBL fold metallo-hydrolase [Pseudoduganella violacea]|uniref:Glyoxylase-like metal-dependent hydrolase (Beta-lactamase superfamily II) n=1 Tax=Pseudoduganella violacea TaxID=1715466 RepID=A0A7W5B956_9BURK|nr:MBL fold metallo-hydrolase [Pseudoduganella violacea]MBB3118155.1 glyoxylase-like metal-dependent hydrolase (beta-lactamase superfamily II) [Pseudoduganella violacea]